MGKLRFKEFGNLPTVSHTANKWQNEYLNSGLADAQSLVLSNGPQKSPSNLKSLLPSRQETSQVASQMGKWVVSLRVLATSQRGLPDHQDLKKPPLLLFHFHSLHLRLLQERIF